MFRYGIAALVMVAAVGGALFFFAGRAEAPTGIASSAAAPEVGVAAAGTGRFDVAIAFDGENFEPRELTVAKGTRVRFLNTSDTEVWPASAIHPTHSIYPGKDEADCLGSSFDACRPLEGGEYFDFTFDYAGEWRYHDHIHAYKTGVVTVTE